MIQKIKQSQIEKAKVANLPTRPNRPSLYNTEYLSPDKLKARFDALPLLSVNLINELIDLINNGKIGDEVPILTVGDGEEKQTLTIADLAKKITDGGISEILKITDGVTLLSFYNEYLSSPEIDEAEININLKKGLGDGSVVQKQGGITNSSGSEVAPAEATGKSAVALGARTGAYGDASVAMGYNAYAYQQGSVSLGGTAGNEKGEDKYGFCFSSNSGKALGKYSTAINTVEANGAESFAFGKNTKANGLYSSAGGWETEAIGQCSFSIGHKTHSYGNYSFACGDGSFTAVSGANSFACGDHVVSVSPRCLTHGSYNSYDNSERNYLHVVGNGFLYDGKEYRSNAYTLDNKGDGWYAGKVTVGADKKELATQEFVSTAIEEAFAKIGVAEGGAY